jgi:glyoxalase family protein
MPYPIVGLHHVTATVDRAQADLDFCLDALGLRLVKKTVNFDNHHVYHFYYGDEQGNPARFDDVPVSRSRRAVVGIRAPVGSNHVFSVPADSMSWRSRLTAHGFTAEAAESRFGESSVVVSDPSGLAIELVSNGRDRRSPWLDGGVRGRRDPRSSQRN